MDNQEKKMVIKKASADYKREKVASVDRQQAVQDVSGYGNPFRPYQPGPVYNYVPQGYMNIPVAEMGVEMGETLKKKMVGSSKLAACRVEYKREIGFVFHENTLGGKPLFRNCVGEVQVIKVSVCKEKYSFALIEIDGQAVVIQESDMKPTILYDEFVRSGFIFNPQINKKKAGEALCEYLNREIGEERHRIELSGDAGWEAGEFKTASDFGFLEKYRHVLDIPVFEKRFDKEAINLARIKDYETQIQDIRDPQNRVIISLIPFAGILYSLLMARNLPAPCVLNFVMLTDTFNLGDIVYYFQIFNREGQMKPYNAGMSSKELKKIINSSKDEVLIFEGFEDPFETYYMNQKNRKTLNSLAKKALGKCGVESGEKDFRSVLVLISNQQILQGGIKQIFMDDKFFINSDRNHAVDAIQPVLAIFVVYIATEWGNLEQLVEQEQKKDTSREEIYWRSLLRVVDDFWRYANQSLNKILGLPEDMDYEFLWQDNSEEFENAAACVKEVVRKSVRGIDAVKKARGMSGDCFIYDDDFIWISTELFSNILRHNGLGTSQNQILLGCRNEGFLKTNPSSRGFITRLQIDGNRRDFYKFDRSGFTDLGEVEIIDLAGGKTAC